MLNKLAKNRKRTDKSYCFDFQMPSYFEMFFILEKCFCTDWNDIVDGTSSPGNSAALLVPYKNLKHSSLIQFD